MNSVNKIIEQLGLQPHPEGGFFKETYRSKGTISKNELGAPYTGERNYSTCIYFLLTSDRFSAFHRIKQDEIWHFYDGSALRLHMISDEGEHSAHIIGKNLSEGEVPQFVVPGGYWFAAEVIEPNFYTFVGCTVAPGFSFDDFELKSQKDLTTLFPDLADIISKLTHY